MSASLNHPEALIGVALGIEAIILGMAPKGEFYALGPGQRPTPNTKTMPRWLGRLWFVGWGCVVLYWCVPRLLGRWHWSELWADWWIAAFFLAVWLGKRLIGKMNSSEPKSRVQTLDLREKRHHPDS